MHLITYRLKNQTERHVGVLSPDDGRIAPLYNFGLPYKSMNEIILRMSDRELAALREIYRTPEKYTLDLCDVDLMAPIPEPLQDVICLGLNYTEHNEEAAAYSQSAFTKKQQYPVYFSKRANYCPGDRETIPSYPDYTNSLDYEAELGVIIGSDAKNVSVEDVPSYIFGYTIINDISARDLQTRHSQWYLGKSLDGFTPMGPAIVTKDEIHFPPKLSISCKVNGKLRQNSTTDMMIFGIADIIHDLTQGMTLKAGTIISTGTPKGVGMGMNPPTFLKKGDTVACSIEGIGTLTNKIG